MESRENTPSQPRHLETELSTRLEKIEEQIKNINAEKNEQINTFNKRKELFTASLKKPDEFIKAYDDTMRKYVYFYDYLPALLSNLQIAISFKNEVILREFRDIDKAASDFQLKFFQEALELNKIAIDLHELVEKFDKTEMELTNEKKQILQKLHQTPNNPSSFFQPSVSTSNECTKPLTESQTLIGGQCSLTM